ncbi:MAG: ATP-binding cassette domain-containing protein [Chlamydiales bacterium]|nr:ATP-binding cassette domain-containing protein [Chlamydiales bacterium]
MITLHELSFSYEKAKILNNISFKVHSGEIVALIGISGSGKTTLFRLMTGMLEPQEGAILVNDSPLPEGNRHISYMQQEDLLLPWRNVLSNLLLVGELGEAQIDDALRRRAHELLKAVGLEGCERKMPEALSGGMRQRVSLVRALLQNRPLLLLDEPFGPLDVIIREELYTLLRHIRAQFAKTIVMVTHDFRDAIALADRILVLNEGEICYDVAVTNREDPQEKEKLMMDIRAALSARLPGSPLGMEKPPSSTPLLTR